MKRVQKEKEVNPKKSVFLFSEANPLGEIFKFVGGADSEECKAMLENGYFDTPAQLDLPEKELELTTEQVQRMRPEDLKAMLESYGFIVLTPEQLTAEVNKLVSTHIDITEFTDDALIEEAERRGLKEGGDTKNQLMLDGSEEFINTTEIMSTEELLEKFEEDPKSLTKEEHIILGKELGLKLRINFGEDTMISKIKEALTDK